MTVPRRKEHCMEPPQGNPPVRSRAATILLPPPRLLWRRRRLTLGLVLLALLLLNVLAYLHARSMTHYAADGVATLRPEAMSRLDKVRALLLGVTVPRPVNDNRPADVGLTAEVHRFSSEPGVELEAWYLPHPRPAGLVLLFHGYRSSRSSLLQEAKAFHERGYATFLVDFRGSGGSSGNVTTMGVAEADDVAAACRYAATRWPEQAQLLFGRSMGSAAVLRAVAVHQLKPRAIILES